MADKKRKLSISASSGVSLISSENENKKLRQTIQDCSDEFICPITLKLPFHPVIAEDGRVYEREAIETWLNSSGQLQQPPPRSNGAVDKPRMLYKSPVTNEPIGPRLVNAIQVRNLIEAMVRSDAVPHDRSFEWKELLANRDVFNAWRRQAEENDVPSMLCLGVALRSGSHGVARKDGLAAARWLTKALTTLSNAAEEHKPIAAGAAGGAATATAGALVGSSSVPSSSSSSSSSSSFPSTSAMIETMMMGLHAKLFPASPSAGSSSSSSSSSIDIDTSNNNDDDVMSGEHSNKAMAAAAMAELRIIERDWCPVPYMGGQEIVTSKMRAILMDWIVEVHFLLGYKADTLHLTVAIVDRYGGAHQLLREKLQLVGVTALLMACKANNEPSIPLPTYLAYLTANAYTAEEIVSTEQVMARHFRGGVGVGGEGETAAQSSSPSRASAGGEGMVGAPTAHFFLVEALKACNVCMGGQSDDDEDRHREAKDGSTDVVTYHRALFFVECTLLDHDLLRFPPSVLAASAALLARRIQCGMLKTTTTTTTTLADILEIPQEETDQQRAALDSSRGDEDHCATSPRRSQRRSSSIGESSGAGTTSPQQPDVEGTPAEMEDEEGEGGEVAQEKEPYLVWPPAAAAVSGYTEADLAACCEVMVKETLRKPPQKTAQGRVLDAVHKKFKNSRFLCIAEDLKSWHAHLSVSPGSADGETLASPVSVSQANGKSLLRASAASAVAGGDDALPLASPAASSASSSATTTWSSAPYPSLPPTRSSTVSSVSTPIETAHSTGTAVPSTRAVASSARRSAARPLPSATPPPLRSTLPAEQFRQRVSTRRTPAAASNRRTRSTRSAPLPVSDSN